MAPFFTSSTSAPATPDCNTNNNSDTTNAATTTSSDDSQPSRVSIFPVAQWSSSIRNEAMSVYDESKLLFAIGVPYGTIGVFREVYKTEAAGPRRFQRALLPTALSVPMWVAAFAGLHYTYKGARAIAKEEHQLTASLLASSLLGAVVNIADGPRAIARGAVTMPGYYLAGLAMWVGWDLMQEQLKEQSDEEHTKVASADKDS